MSTGLNWKRLCGALALSVAVLCVASPPAAADTATSTHKQKKTKKAAPLAPLPSGPTGPVQQIPLDSIAAVPPQVKYEGSQLTIVAPNSTLADVLRAVRKQTGADIEIPSAPDRVVTRLGPGPAREVVAELLNGSRFNYVLLGSPSDDTALTRVVLVAKSAAENAVAAAPQPGIQQVNNGPPPEQAAQADPSEADAAAEDNAATDDNADQAAAEAEQPVTTPDQPGAKTPQQMLQEMQQRQMQLQQQQPGQPGQPGMPGSGMPPHPPQEQ
jgi:hypothetical protein